MKDKREALIQELWMNHKPHTDLNELADFILARERSLRETMGKVREVFEGHTCGCTCGMKGLKALAILNEAYKEGK
jgi:hypothetical protein